MHQDVALGGLIQDTVEATSEEQVGAPAEAALPTPGSDGVEPPILHLGLTPRTSGRRQLSSGLGAAHALGHGLKAVEEAHVASSRRARWAEWHAPG